MPCHSHPFAAAISGEKGEESAVPSPARTCEAKTQKEREARLDCHPDEAKSSASPRTSKEGPLHVAGTIAATDKSTGPSVRKALVRFL
jgi:hypothetical protein